MISLAELARAGPKPSALLFDLDDTLLTDGVLERSAYDALWRLHDAGIALIGVTGRPAGWGEVLVRQWPVRAMVTENGAVRSHRQGRAVVTTLSFGGQAANEAMAAGPFVERRARRAATVDAIRAALPTLPLADDNAARITDTTLDVGELHYASPQDIAEARHIARVAGARTLVSSVHLHVTFEPDDKASGAFAALAAYLRFDPAAARASCYFIGDSGNDAACFAAFPHSIGVANVRKSLGALTVPPRYVASLEKGAGFAEAAAALLEAHARRDTQAR